MVSSTQEPGADSGPTIFQPGGEIGPRLVEVAAIITPSKLLQATVAMLARQMIEGVPDEMHVGAVEEVLCI